MSLNLCGNYYDYIIGNYSNVEKVFSNIERQYLNDKLEIRNIPSNPNHYFKSLIKRLDFLKLVYELKVECDFVYKNDGRYRVYLPILRSIKRSDNMNPQSFLNTTRQLYDFKDESIFTGLDMYDKVLRIRNNVKEHRRDFEKFEKFLSQYFFNQKSVEIISSLDKDEHLIFYVGGEERKIHDIGDGVQAIILLMFSIFTASQNTWIFIEEPETFLHPGLQRIFIETLLEDDYLKSKNLHYFFTTHSNHFLDLTLSNNEISIFQFEKQKSNMFEVKINVRPNKEILDILGVNTSSVFLANSSIWVEGPTDRKYLSFFLKSIVIQRISNF